MAMESTRVEARGAAAREPASGLGARAERWLLGKLYEGAGRPAVRFRLSDGTEVGGPVGAPALVIRDRATLLRLVLDSEMYFGEAYTDGRVEVEGDFVDFLSEVCRSTRDAPPVGALHHGAARLFLAGQRPRANTPEAARENISRHYDIGNDFYKLWLDRDLIYTCAYFRSPDDTLEEAQQAKLDHVCRKLRLAPGESVVEAGCGWGTLALHMAARYGVRVRAYNISREQIAFARERAQEVGLASRVEFVEDDYRAIEGRYDAFVSVGMLEHIGLENYENLGRVIDRSLGAGGRGFLHFIGRARPRPLNAWIERRIFPGAHIPALSEALAVLEPHDFAVEDVENLRLHYERTLACWLERFERAAPKVERMYDARLVRAWRMYLGGSIAAFRTAWLELFQVAFARVGKNDLPRTRAHLYGGPRDSWTAATS